MRDAWALTAGPRPYLEDLLNCKDPLPTVDASFMSAHAAEAQYRVSSAESWTAMAVVGSSQGNNDPAPSWFTYRPWTSVGR